MKYVSDYLDFLEVSRKKVRPGDIFCFRIINNGPYFYGRNIKTDAEFGLSPGSAPIGILVYIYQYYTDNIALITEYLTKDNLIIPLLMINKQGWLQG